MLKHARSIFLLSEIQCAPRLGSPENGSWVTLVLVLLLSFLASRQCLTFRITTSPFVAENSTSSPSATFSISAISGGIVSLRDPPILTRVRLSVIGIGSPSGYSESLYLYFHRYSEYSGHISMNRTNTVQVLHPSKDGTLSQGSYLRLLIEVCREAGNGMKRAELREIQKALLARGWHP